MRNTTLFCLLANLKAFIFVVKEIIQAHDGDIKVESKLGQGTTFTMTLPRSVTG